MTDQICTIGKSVIQHGRYNDRIYLMKLHKNDLKQIIPKLLDLAKRNNYGKLFCKVPEWGVEHFLEHHFIREAEIPLFYQGEIAVNFCSLFLDKKRQNLQHNEEKQIEDNLNIALKKGQAAHRTISDDLDIYPIGEAKVEQLASLYQQVFDSYPFPVHDAKYLRETMKSHVEYFGVCEGQTLVAAASSEKDMEAQNAEMTDFATLIQYRSHGYGTKLLTHMEDQMMQKDMKCLYTIARAHSAGINILFAKHHYKFAGTLIHNTQISGEIESMNVWYKLLN